nr:LuxR family transcriptional regulator [Chloroflexota bacterium]
MPKPPTHALVWGSESASYELWTQGYREISFQASNEAQWLAWLETHLAFSFRGQGGHMNVLKESRQRGRGYWYAYRSLEKRTIKRYLGPTARVTLALLEEVAGKLGQELVVTGTRAPAAASGAEIPQEAPARARPEHASVLPALSLKFHPPRLRVQLVERPRLVQLLEDGLTSGLTLLSAPAGFGKTTLVSQWLASLQKEGPVVAWISLDESDNDVVRFWHCVASACREMLGERAQTVLEQLIALGRSPSLLEAPVLELVLTTFLNELAASSGRGIIALEDYHFITTPQIHTSLSFWLEHLPPNLHVVIMTRNDPPLPLAQWRVRGMLHEIRRGDL